MLSILRYQSLAHWLREIQHSSKRASAERDCFSLSASKNSTSAADDRRKQPLSEKIFTGAFFFGFGRHLVLQSLQTRIQCHRNRRKRILTQALKQKVINRDHFHLLGLKGKAGWTKAIVVCLPVQVPGPAQVNQAAEDPTFMIDLVLRNQHMQILNNCPGNINLQKLIPPLFWGGGLKTPEKNCWGYKNPLLFGLGVLKPLVF